MSSPQNPLDFSASTSHKHVLIAFKYGEDAFAVDRDNSRKIDPTALITGESLEGFGINVVVTNEFTDQRYSIGEAIWDFDFIPSIGVSTSSGVGKIVVNDRVVPYSFLDFLHNDVLAVLNDEAGVERMGLSQATFVLKTFFTSDSDEGGSIDIVQAAPYFFNVGSIESVPLTSDVSPRSHVLSTLAVSNSLGVLRSFSSVFQMNITHKDGNVHNEIPTVADNTGLDSRESENAAYRKTRKNRMDKSKPMLTLKDMFEGLEADLNQQKFVHQAQIQRWSREVRDDHIDNITVAPQQTKGPTPESLPVDFTIDLDDIYFDYNVDNRNMPFEQPDVRQDNVGIRVFPVRTGTDIVELIERVMVLSQGVGDDAIADIKKTFKTTITAERKVTNRYVINIKIRQYNLPCNPSDEEVNTGPGTAIEPLQFFVNDPEERDVDIISFKSNINYQVGDTMLESQVNDNPTAKTVYGNREQATAERRPDLSFFETLYSGIRPMIGSYTIDGLESAERAGDVMNQLDPYTYTQTTDYELVIRGNPFLMSDVNRNPADVIEDLDGAVNYYPRPEVNPMYVKLTLFLNSHSATDNDDDIPERFYFDGYYHMCRVVNMFGVINGARSFTQMLVLKRTDDTL